MPIVSTSTWTEPKEISRYLARYFKKLKEKEYMELLFNYGMCPPSLMFIKELEEMKKRQVWKKVKAHYEKLKKAWNGPDVAVLVLPSNPRNRKMQRQFNGRAGVAFTDKLFVFMTSHTSDEEMLAVLTHEYHHVCRLKAINKSDEMITLLDAMMMEGLAERAVEEYCGKKYLAPWTNYYTIEEAKKMWEKHVKPYYNLRTDEKKYDQLLFGQNWYPEMMGYNIGYHLVTSCMKPHTLTTTQLLPLSTNTILKKSAFQL
ncbi:DUF2268 domain-containing putative Zn-dependent protease [Priestia megaterium]|uniref:DUF2268 domain-containing protein n=1 Tax=Priestia megaterium TaxID=1404 RepID=UPI0026E28C31|nr:DUF2268 domain-containing putative Zn-dependent protease [Priestia megaterium]MDO6850785.1 DUF2268 domain-containing putative Zn-dependent protease [Priestia megaterium]